MEWLIKVNLSSFECFGYHFIRTRLSVTRMANVAYCDIKLNHSIVFTILIRYRFFLSCNRSRNRTYNVDIELWEAHFQLIYLAFSFPPSDYFTISLTTIQIYKINKHKSSHFRKSYPHFYFFFEVNILINSSGAITNKVVIPMVVIRTISIMFIINFNEKVGMGLPFLSNFITFTTSKFNSFILIVNGGNSLSQSLYKYTT